MGLFDNIFINIDKLPISDLEKTKIGNNFITKDFENILSDIYITDDNELKISTFEYEIVPKHERPYPNDNGIKGLLGSMRKINEKLNTINYHGYIKFYNTFNKESYDFIAKFTDGKLVNIERIFGD